ARIHATVPQDREALARADERRDPYVRRRAIVETVRADGAERTEAGKIRVERAGVRADSRRALLPRMLRAEHRFAQVLVGRRIASVVVGQELIALGLLRAGERLLGAVVDARDAEAEQLNGHSGED